jgi:mRNA-degrading endonuclease RelE of RelBE toxin-antitoxin system
MSYNIYTTSSFEKELKNLSKKYRSIKDDILSLSKSLKNNPLQGIPLGKDCYKVRMAISSKNSGKSGGARVITCVKIINQNVYLVSIFDKSEKENISDDELTKIIKSSELI